jgi:hypothetical protein
MRCKLLLCVIFLSIPLQAMAHPGHTLRDQVVGSAYGVEWDAALLVLTAVVVYAVVNHTLRPTRTFKTRHTKHKNHK